MNAIQADVDATMRAVFAGDLADGGRQAESVEIDGRPVLGKLNFDAQETELVAGGWNENVKGVFSTLKSYFPNGFPKKMTSVLQCRVGGEACRYQVLDLNGDKDNRARLFIGLGAFTNRKG